MRIFLLILALFLFPAAVHAEGRVALVIGNGAYAHAGQLPNPVNDARDVAARLRSLGFDVVDGFDLDIGTMQQRMREFFGRIRDADIALFFYAGHGMQIAGENYLVPVDARLASEDDLSFEAARLDTIQSSMERNASVSIVLIDACRDNPLAKNLARNMGTRSSTVGSGLAKAEAGVGSFIAFSTQPGNVALDGTGRNSPFTAALVKHLGGPGRSISDDLIMVRREVLTATGGKQVPWDSSSLTGPVVLAPGTGTTVPGTGNASDTDLETSFWNSVKDSSDPRALQAYMKRFPNGAFIDLAKLRLEAISVVPKADPAPGKIPVPTSAGRQPPANPAKPRFEGIKRIVTSGYNGPDYVEGEFNRVAERIWEERNTQMGARPLRFETRDQTEKLLLLYDASRKIWLRFDFRAGKLTWRLDDQRNWNPLYNIVRVE